MGYRAGIAGPFKPFDQGSQKEASITSLPLVAMDSAIAAQFAEIYEDTVEDMVGHLSWWVELFPCFFIQACLRTLNMRKQLECTSLLGIFLQYDAISKTPLVILKEMASDNERQP